MDDQRNHGLCQLDASFHICWKYCCLSLFLRQPWCPIFSTVAVTPLWPHSSGTMATKTRSGQQGKQGSTSQLTPDEEDALFKLRLQEALNDEQVAKRLARIIRSVNQDLLDGITSLRAEVQSLKAQLNDRDAQIASLKVEVRKLREDHDALEQYGRRNNLRISGLPEPQLEPDQAEDTTGTIVQLANDVLKLDPPLQATDIEVSHRLKRPKNARQGEPRPVIVRFRSKQERFRVISNYKHMKDHNENQDNPFNIYILMRTVHSCVQNCFHWLDFSRKRNISVRSGHTMVAYEWKIYKVLCKSLPSLMIFTDYFLVSICLQLSKSFIL